MFIVLNKKAVFYYSILLAALVNIPRLLVYSQHVSEYRLLKFNFFEWGSSFILSFLYVMLVFTFNDKKIKMFYLPVSQKYMVGAISVNILGWIVFILLGASISHIFIKNHTFPFNGYILRFSILLFLSLLSVKVMAINYYTRDKERENEALRLANTQKDLALLKSQLNPHFLFNAFSSLSSIVNENPGKAQQYIVQLSQYFRYSLNNKDENITNLKEELSAMENFCGILSMRLENGFRFTYNISDPHVLLSKIPHISLQPLIENAVKHNIATKLHPLLIEIYDIEGYIVVKNNIQEKPFPELGTGTGLANLSERYRLLFKKQIEVLNDGLFFIVKLPIG